MAMPMMSDDNSPLEELQAFLDELESLAPIHQETHPTIVSYRLIDPSEVIEDSLPPEESLQEATVTERIEFDNMRDNQVHGFQAVRSGPIAAVDCGIARLGETENGLVIALRASIIVDHNGQSLIYLYRTGPIYLHNHYKKEMLYQMGKQLGKPDHFVEIDETDPENPIPTRVKSGVAYDAHKYGDRFRNWFERLTQRIAINKIENGTILLDGALTLRTIDTPDLFIERLAENASSKGNSLIAISKQSLLQVREKPIRFWLNDAPNHPCYRYLSNLMRSEESERVLGNTYAARFSAIGPTFRIDVKAVTGQSDDEAINQFYSSTLMRGGYPDILVRAHTHSYFTSPDVIQLQAQASIKYSFIPQGEIDLSGVFGPFGGRFK
jgi:hypothetical protein